MKKSLIFIGCLMIVALVLTGCKSSGGGSSYVSGGVADVADAGAGAGDGDGAGILGGGGLTNPEPATAALLGGGLIAYAFIRRRKRK